MFDTTNFDPNATYDAGQDDCRQLAAAVVAVRDVLPTEPPPLEADVLTTEQPATATNSFSKPIRLATAAGVSLLTTAAVVIAAITAFQWSSNSAYALQSEVNAAVKAAKSVRYVETQGPLNQKGHSETHSIRGRFERIDQYQGYLVRDFEKGLCLQTCRVCKPSEAVRFRIGSRVQMPELQPFPAVHQSDEPKPGWAKTTVTKTILDGREVLLIESRRLPTKELPQGAWGHGEVQRNWIDPTTRLPVRAQVVYHEDAEQTNARQLLLHDYEWNIDLDDELFSLEPPADYEFNDRTNEPE